jgi:tripartite-type tricarboxylate transporter receptor subunit TctC
MTPPMDTKRRRLSMAIAGAGLAGAAPLSSWAQGAYPSKPIHVVVPFGAGSLTDSTFRLIAPTFASSLGATFVVENKAGASGIIGSNFVRKAAPDGYTLLMAAVTSHGSGPALFRDLPYDVEKDFAPIGLVGAPPAFFAVHPSVPATDLKTFVTWAKKQPTPVTYASVGNGSSGHLTAELFSIESGCQFTHVPYKEANQAVTDLIGGHVKFMIYYAPLIPHIRSGALRALAVLSDARPTFAANVSTAREQGYPSIESYGWTGLFGPAGLNQGLISKINGALTKSLSDPDLARLMGEQGQQVKLLTPLEFADFLRTDRAKWARVVEVAKITI